MRCCFNLMFDSPLSYIYDLQYKIQERHLLVKKYASNTHSDQIQSPNTSHVFTMVHTFFINFHHFCLRYVFGTCVWYMCSSVGTYIANCMVKSIYCLIQHCCVVDETRQEDANLFRTFVSDILGVWDTLTPKLVTRRVRGWILTQPNDLIDADGILARSLWACDWTLITFFSDPFEYLFQTMDVEIRQSV